MDDKRKPVAIVGHGPSNRGSHFMETMMMLGSMTYDNPPISSLKVCTKAKGNRSKYGKKCRHSGSCDGTKRPCKFATY